MLSNRFLQNFVSVLLIGFVLLLPLDIFSQSVNAYPKDGQIKDLKGKVQQDIVVAKDGTGDFLFIQDAIESIRVYLPKPITVYIKAGVYKEKLIIPGTITNVTFRGDGPEKTIITFDDHTGKNKLDTFGSYTLKVLGNSLIFRDMTIQNTAGNVGQAVALHAEGDRLVFENCHFKGDQDTVFASGENSRQYYKNCYIEGTTDFIFGSATALFENCEIHSKSNSFITAASTPEWVEIGYVFKDCKLTAAEGIDRVYLGRPWRDFAKTVFINCEMGSHILPGGWDNWGRPETAQTTYYGEFGSKGAGANLTKRVDWSYQMSEEESKKYQKELIFAGKFGSKNAYGQDWFGHAVDTSFTLRSAYQKEKKKYPQIKPVEDTPMTGVMERLGIAYKELGYRALQLDVFYPENKKGGLLPGIILVHGGGWKSGDRTLQIPLAKALAAKGYVTAVVDYRLSLEARFPAAVFDIKYAVKWLKANGDQFRLDSNKIAVSGSSAGGQLANLVGFTNGQSRYEESSLSSNSSEVHAIINMDGVLAFHHPESEEGEMAALWLGGTYAEIPEIWKAASPLSQVSEIARPILFINSQFQRFHAGRDEVIAQMEAFGIYTEVQTVENSPHTFWLFSPWFDPTADLMDRFLKRVF